MKPIKYTQLKASCAFHNRKAVDCHANLRLFNGTDLNIKGFTVFKVFLPKIVKIKGFMAIKFFLTKIVKCLGKFQVSESNFQSNFFLLLINFTLQGLSPIIK
jgi:hypothetical protein